MLQKIRDLTRMQQEVDTLGGKLDDYGAGVRSLSAHLERLTDNIKVLSDTQYKLTKELTAERASITAARDELTSEVADFKLLKSRVEKKVIEMVEGQLVSLVEKKTGELAETISGLSSLTADHELLATQLGAVGREIDRLLTLTTRIKSADVDLSAAAREMRERDDEKLRLMKRVDELERMLAKFKRR